MVDNSYLFIGLGQLRLTKTPVHTLSSEEVGHNVPVRNSTGALTHSVENIE